MEYGIASLARLWYVMAKCLSLFVSYSLKPKSEYGVGRQDARLDDPFGSPTGSVTGAGGSEPRGPVASQSLASADAEDLSVADEYLDYSNRVAGYIRMLERRLEAAEKSNDAKAHRIEKMQEEIDRLKVSNEELERSLAALT